MPNVINKMIVRQLTGAFQGAEGLLVVSMNGLTVAESEALRDGLAEQGVELRMVRNRLAEIALRETGHEPPKDLLLGNIGISWGDPEAAIHAAKVVKKSAAKKAGKLTIQGGMLEGNFLDSNEATALAELPGKQELQAMLLGVLSGPARNLVGVVNAPLASLARVLQAHIDAAGAGATEADA